MRPVLDYSDAPRRPTPDVPRRPTFGSGAVLAAPLVSLATGPVLALAVGQFAPCFSTVVFLGCVAWAAVASDDVVAWRHRLRVEAAATDAGAEVASPLPTRPLLPVAGLFLLQVAVIAGGWLLAGLLFERYSLGFFRD